MEEKYVGPMAGFTDEAVFPVKTPLKKDGSVDYLELWKKVNEQGIKLYGLYRMLRR